MARGAGRDHASALRAGSLVANGAHSPSQCVVSPAPSVSPSRAEAAPKQCIVTVSPWGARFSRAMSHSAASEQRAS